MAYLEAADRYTDSVTEMSRLANGLDRAAFLLSYERARTLVVEAEEARSVLRRSDDVNSGGQIPFPGYETIPQNPPNKRNSEVTLAN